MRKTRELPPPLELLCLKALWSLNQGSVADVQRSLAESRNLAYTTVMTLLERLVRRGIVTRRKAGRFFVYSPAASPDSVRSLAVREFIDCFFNGSKDDLVAYLENGASAVLPERPAPSGLETALL